MVVARGAYTLGSVRTFTWPITVYPLPFTGTLLTRESTRWYTGFGVDTGYGGIQEPLPAAAALLLGLFPGQLIGWLTGIVSGLL